MSDDLEVQKTFTAALGETLRYHPSEFGDGMIPAPRGDWVRNEDFAARIEELTRERDEARGEHDDATTAARANYAAFEREKARADRLARAAKRYLAAIDAFDGKGDIDAKLEEVTFARHDLSKELEDKTDPA